MIEGLVGILSSITENKINMYCNGIIYGVNVHKNINYKECRYEDSKHFLYVTSIYTEKSHELYGHADSNEKELFQKMLKLPRMGARTIMKIFGQIKYDDLIEAIKSGDVRKLKNINGIGSKMVQTVIENLQGEL